ncbi:MAG: branched-chain amino acid transaminase [Acidimicrobiia bacterium]|nr:branched-chain amino acid transaminase [Acidimicrobiia bacterium]MDH3397655.1 branched-chain amino acid transaminase [Acidimicrobiia bacterium]
METSRVIWMDGEFVPWDEATVHVLSHGLHYGTGVFEGIRAYETPTGTAVFRLTEHMERLHRSAKAYGIPLRFGVDELVKASRQLLVDNELESGYLRPLAFYGLGSIGLNPAGAEVRVIIAAWQWGAYLGEDGLKNGIRTQVSSWRRIDQAMLNPNAKGTGGYLNSILAKQDAVKNSYDEAILLNSQGFVSEGSGENIFVIKNGVVTTPPVTAGILEGITRDSVMTLLRDDGHQVQEANVIRSDLYYADEIFFTGTAAEVTPVREVDDRPVGDGRPGPVTRKAQDLFQKAVTGRLEAYRHWLDYV